MTHKTTPRIGVVGCGAIAQRYHLPALVSAATRRPQLILADPNVERLRVVAGQFGVTDMVSHYEELAGRVDGVIVATPPPLHHRIGMFFLRRSVHVLCEKPLAENLEHARQMVSAATEAQVALAVNHTRRLFPTYGKIRELIGSGELGRLKSITYHDGFEFNWPAASPHHFAKDAHGVLADTGIHLLDTICWWLDARPDLITSANDSHGGPEAMATVRLKHEGTDIELKVSRLGRLANEFRIEGTRGSIVAGNEDWREIKIRFLNGRTKRIRCASKQKQYNDFGIPLISNFLDVVQGRAEPLVTGESALAAVELLEQAYLRSEPMSEPWNANWETVHAV